MLGLALLFSLVVSLIMAMLFHLLHLRGPWRSAAIFFSIVFLVTFISTQWMIPVGPVVWNFYWIPPLLTAIVVALLIASFTPVNKTKKSGKKDKPQGWDNSSIKRSLGSVYEGDEPQGGIVIGAVFWIFLFFLMVLAIAGVVFHLPIID